MFGPSDGGFMRSFSILLLTVSLQISAQPTNPSPQVGECSFREHESTLSILSSDRAIIHWDSFSIQAGEITEFIQPSSQSIVLNRVTGNAASAILGNLHSNGQVVLINPLGLYIGKDGCVDTASFTGATLDLLDQDFLRGQELLFAGESEAKIVNLGRIESRCGDIFLLSRKIENRGALLAENGAVKLGAGSKVLIVPNRDRRITIEVGNGSIDDEGTISALAIELRAKNPYELAIQTKGHLRASGREEKNGRIYLIAEEGRTHVQGSLLAKGGEIQVLGTEVLLDEGSSIDVSAPRGGGSVFIGGDYQGNNPFIKNADFTTIAPSVRINAQAQERGEGGRVIVWANRVARFSGEIDVCGGPEGGDGGFVEVSGLERFYYEGRCDRRAPFGEAGTLFLDPESDITINAAGPDSGGGFAGGVYTPTASPSVIRTTTLVSELGLGNVVINTAFGGPGGGAGDVTVSSSFSWATANTLTINCARTFSIGAGVTLSSTNTGNFTALIVNANSSGVTTGTFSGVLVNAGGTITSVGGHLTLNGIGGTTGNSSNGVRVFGEVRTLDGTITLTGTGKSSGVTSDGVSVESGGKVRATGAGSIVATGTGSSSGTGSSGVIVTGAGSSIDTQEGNITLTGDVAIASSNCTGILISSSGEVSTLSGTITGTGMTSGGTTNNRGVFVTDLSSLITAEEGAIDLTGTGSGTSSCHGVFISTGGQLESTGLTSSAATISLDGTGSQTGLSFCHGSEVLGTGSSIISNSGNIFVRGRAGGTSDQNDGVIVADFGLISSTGTGSNAATITLDGVGGFSSVGNGARGVFLFDSGAVESVDGDITFIGQGGGTTSLLHGVSVDGGFVRSTGTGSDAAKITMTGTAGNGTGLCNGVFVLGGAMVESKDGDISLTGTAAGTGNGSGVSIFSGSTVRSTSSALITMDGLGALNATLNSNGTAIGGLSMVETVDGDVTITGTGMGLSNGAGISVNNATLSTTGAGKFDLIGDTLATGGASNGIIVNNGGVIQSTGTGTLSLDGTGGTSYGIRVADLVTSINSDSASITLIGRDSGGTEKGIWITSSAVVQSNISAALSFSTFSDMDIDEGGQIIGGSGPVQLSISRDLTITGGSGAALISGILLGDGTLTAFVGRNLRLEGGTGASSHAQIGSRNSSSSANIHFTSIGENATIDGFDLASFALIGHGNETLVGTTYSGNISLDEIGGNLSVLGANQGAGGFGFGQIGHFNDVGSTVSGNINAIAEGSIFVTGGSAGTTARACIGHGGSGPPNVNAAIDLSASIDIDLSQEGQIIGGAGLVQLAASRDLSITGGSGAGRISGVLLGNGNLIARVGRNLSLEGGTGASSHAQIGSRNSSSSANIRFTSIGGSATIDGFDLASFALIGHGDETLVGTTYSGNISFDQIGGNLSVLGANQGGGGFGFGQIGHLNSAGSTLSGNIFAFAENSIFVTGGSAGATARARIGHGGNGVLGTFGGIEMLLIANDNFEMHSFLGVGTAEVVNESQAVGSGNLTIVVDNRFPTFPSFGAGAFILNSTLTATGELRIYTVQPSQNIINDLINGQVFVAAPFGVNTIDQQYNTYFPGGTYTGPAFMVYYKVGGMMQDVAVGALQVAESELQTRLPIFYYIRLFDYPWHHPSFCNYDRCDPGFDPYASFIFEDNVYWIPPSREL